MASGNTVRLSRVLAGKGAVTEIPQPTFRRGQVTHINPVRVAIGDDPTPVEVSAAPSGLAVNDVVDLRVTDTEVTVEGADAPISAGSKTSSVLTSETIAGSVYGDCPTVGPSVSVTVGKTGLLLVTVSCRMAVTDTNDGGFMSFLLSGANTLAASDNTSLEFFPKINGAYFKGSYTKLVTGLVPGVTVAKAQYKTAGADITFDTREIIAVPL